MTSRRYTSPIAFKQAIEQRLRDASEGGADHARRRQLLVFARFLARVAVVLGDAATLKGGLVLELRLARARTTKDVDLRMTGAPDGLLARLQDVGRHDLGDWMSFEITPDRHHPAIESEGIRYLGLRFRAECKLAGKLYGHPFGVDVAFADPMLGDATRIVAPDLLGFAGIEPPTLWVYPIETHIAEKVHAYTMPRSRPNARVKDLPDMALLASAQALDARRLRAALEQTFTFRDTHALPSSLPSPPASWEPPYAAMAAEDRLAWSTLEAVTAAAQAFPDPVLAGGLDASWDPARWRW